MESRFHTSTKIYECQRFIRFNTSQTSVYLKTTTMGLSVFVTTAKPFQIISAEAAIVRIFRNCRATYKRVVSAIFPGSIMNFLSYTCRTFILRNSPNILFKLFIKSLYEWRRNREKQLWNGGCSGD